MNKFFMLYREGGRAPTFKHTVREDAEREAERIAKEHGGPVYLLEAVNVLAPVAAFQWELASATPTEKAKFPTEWVDFDVSQRDMWDEIDKHATLTRVPFTGGRRYAHADVEVAYAGSGCRVRAHTEFGAEWLRQREAQTDANAPPTAERAKEHAAAHGIGGGRGMWLYCVDSGAPIVVCLDDHGLILSPGSSGLCGKFAFQIGGKWFPLAADGSPLPVPNDLNIPF